MGLAQGPPVAVTPRPGGLPLHAFMSTVILPERDIVPLRTRWREDKLFQFGMIAATLFAVGAVVAGLVFAMAHAPAKKAAPPLPVKTAPHR